jgi:hypothetical protein
LFDELHATAAVLTSSTPPSVVAIRFTIVIADQPANRTCSSPGSRQSSEAMASCTC